MNVVDAHHHLWIPEQTDPDLGYGWLRDIGALKPFGDPTPIQRDYEWAEFAAESSAHRLAGSVYVQVDGALPDPAAETAWVQSVFEGTGLPHAIVGLADLSRADLADVLASHSAFGMFQGVRQILSRLDAVPELCFASRHFIKEAAWREGYALLAERDLSFDLQLYPEQMPDVADFIADHPDIPVVIDHAGSPYDTSPAGIARWHSGLQRLAALSHVSVKLSGFGMFDRDWSQRSVEPLVKSLIDLFGYDRLQWGSNFPVDSLMQGYDRVIETVAASLADASESERQAVFANNASHFYRLHDD